MKRLSAGLVCVMMILVSPVINAAVNINTASVNELQTLPKIGPGLAQSIIDYREAHGPFRSIEGIMDVPRIGEKIFNEIKGLITIGKGSAQKIPMENPDSSSVLDLGEKGNTAMEPIQKGTPIPVASPTPEPSMDDIMGQFSHEPGIEAVQKAAVDYAEIDPMRFRSWRQHVKNKALLPDSLQMTVGHDTNDDTDYSRSKTISLTGGTATIGPDDETWGHDTNYDWDYELRMRWNIQDYLFNSDMLRVSSETKSQIGFRQDILNEVTKLYFDRRRLQVEAVLDGKADIQSRVKRELRLQELTAALDGLTGGFFSREIQKNSSDK